MQRYNSGPKHHIISITVEAHQAAKPCSRLLQKFKFEHGYAQIKLCAQSSQSRLQGVERRPVFFEPAMDLAVPIAPLESSPAGSSA